MNIGDREIGLCFRPFIIAEMSGNHNQSLERAIKIVDEAARCGVDAIKLQTYTADTITMDSHRSEFSIRDPKSQWTGRTLYDLYKEAHTPWDWHKPIFDHARKLGLIVFSTPFDEKAVDFLQSLDVPAFKIASFENNHLPLIRRVAETQKPIIMSTGMASLSELDEASRTARLFKSELALLKCTSTYPATPHNTNLATIPAIRSVFECEVGLSDHTMGTGVAVAAVALGATIIEKHFTLSRAEGGVDSAFSLEPYEMKALVEESIRAHESIGVVRFGPTEAEKASLVYRRSIYATVDIPAGSVVRAEHLRIIRPGLGAAPRDLDRIIGRTVRDDVGKGTPLTWDLLL
jgi:N-acetylneuraminate synthase